MFSWTLHQKGSPRGGVAVAVGLELYHFGIWNADESNADQIVVQIFNTVSLDWRRLTTVTTPGIEVLSSCYGPTAVLIGNVVYISGGCELNASYKYYCNRLYAFVVETHTWSKPQVSGTVPELMTNYSACVLGKIMYVYGRQYRRYGATNETYKLDTNTMVWSLVNTRGPNIPVSDEHSTATILGTKMFVFGGCGMGQHYNTMRAFDTENNHWLEAPPGFTHFLPRRVLSVFTYNGDLYIFGDSDLYGGDGDLNDVWRFTPETFSWKKVETKGRVPYPKNRMCCCMVGDRIILFGGRILPCDLYVLDCSPSLKTLCKLSVVQYGVEQSELPHNIRWELAASGD